MKIFTELPTLAVEVTEASTASATSMTSFVASSVCGLHMKWANVGSEIAQMNTLLEAWACYVPTNSVTKIPPHNEVGLYDSDSNGNLLP
jgi:hypothetical protein